MSDESPIKALLMNAVRGRPTYTPDSRKADPINFLMTVGKVQQDPTDHKIYQVAGIRKDNGQKVIVKVVKQNHNQYVPEPGAVMRADSIAVNQERPPAPPWSFYTAGFFRSYATNELCIHGYATPMEPRINPNTNSVTADVHVFDTDVNTVTDTAAGVLKDDRIYAELLRLLKPWEAQKPSSVTHDAKGAPIWGTIQPGITPMVVVKIGELRSMRFFGLGFEETNERLCRPSDQKLTNKIMQSQNVATLKELAKLIDHPDMQSLPITLYPSLVVNVGLDSLKGSEEGHVRFKDNYQLLDDDGEVKQQRGTRMSFLHVKQSRSGRMIAIDLFRDDSHPYVGSLPQTKAEQALIASLAAGQQMTQQDQQGGKQANTGQQQEAPTQQRTTAPENHPAHRAQQDQQTGKQKAVQQPEGQAQQQTIAPETQPAQHDKQGSIVQQQIAPQQQATSESGNYYPDSEQDEAAFDPNDYEMFAADIEAMEQMNASVKPVNDPDLDSLLEEAEKRMEQRPRSLPRM